MTDLAGRHALVLGASGGIGGAVLRALAAAGMRTTAVGRSADKLAALAAATGSRVAAGDLEDPAFLAALLREAGQVDALVAAAGVAIPEPLLESDPSSWERMLRVNVLAVMRVSVALARQMAARGAGTIVHVGSVLARGMMANAVAYAASKHALRAFTDGLRLELAGTGVRVVDVSPGLVGDTEFHRHATHPSLRGAFAQRPYAPIASDDVARCVRLALELPEGTEITRLEVRPRGQTVLAP